MVYASVVLFALAAVGGIVLATNYFKGNVPPIGLALAHGGLAATALVLAIAAVATSTLTGSTIVAAVIAFTVAALGGFYLFSRRFSESPTPLPVIAIHATVAVIGFVILLVAVFG